MEKLTEISSSNVGLVFLFLSFFLVSFSTNTYAGILNDTTIFRIITDPVLVKQPIVIPIIEKTKYAISIMAPSDGINNKIKIFPNSVQEYIQIEGSNINQYKLIALDGSAISSEIKIFPEKLEIDVSNINLGMYLLMLLVEDKWYSCNILKK